MRLPRSIYTGRDGMLAYPSTFRLAVETPSSVNCALRAASRETASFRMPAARALALASAVAWSSTKISAVTVTEPDARVTRTALVGTSAPLAMVAAIDAWAAPSKSATSPLSVNSTYGRRSATPEDEVLSSDQMTA